MNKSVYLKRSWGSITLVSLNYAPARRVVKVFSRKRRRRIRRMTSVRSSVRRQTRFIRSRAPVTKRPRGLSGSSPATLRASVAPVGHWLLRVKRQRIENRSRCRRVANIVRTEFRTSGYFASRV